MRSVRYADARLLPGTRRHIFLLSSRDLILATTLVSCLRDAFVSVIDVRIDVSAGMTAGQVEGNAL